MVAYRPGLRNRYWLFLLNEIEANSLPNVDKNNVNEPSGIPAPTQPYPVIGLGPSEWPLLHRHAKRKSGEFANL